jgi:hypothetical protein
LAGFKLELIHDSDLPRLCTADETKIREQLAGKSKKNRVVVVPDLNTMRWHHAREDFLSKKLLHRDFSVKGAMVTGEHGSAWGIWTHLFRDKIDRDGLPMGDLCFLRLVCDEENPQSEAMVKLLFQVAQKEAAASKMLDVHVWNPSDLVTRAGRAIATDDSKGGSPKEVLVHREEESIPSLLWLGHTDSSSTLEVEWLANEKFAWC